ncbi:hypothetical protein FN846DRAFT_899407 [Sphaerosporella brunnea]|uniref:DUF7909 domain-containing protein n=1 Tax=Sphaerosporella brunnea TaxID=1250544 RepID=A0A5J5ETR5_9PEZI|nr:hypothetical protein FN846DRAFT_899407 [Sphaerosporella brunnea]
MPFRLSLLLLLIPFTNACTPAPTPLPNPTITAPFALEVHNTTYPQVHKRRLNFWKAGGGDNHLFLSPAGDAVSNHTLLSGVLTNTEWWEGKNVIIRAVVNGEYTAYDNTTKMFMTQRNDPRAAFEVWDGCDPDSDLGKLVLRLKGGDAVCVRPASGERWEFRFSGKGNTKDAGCVHVELGVVFS